MGITILSRLRKYNVSIATQTMGWIISRVNSTENPWLRHRMPRFYIHIQLQINWINDHNRHKVSVWVCNTCTRRAFLCHCCLVRHQSHWLCLCCVDRKEAALVGRLWRQQLTQETTGRTGAGGGGGGGGGGQWWGWLGTQSRSLTNIVPPQGRKQDEYTWHNQPNGAL